MKTLKTMESASNINIFEFSSLFSVSIVLRLILFVYYLVALIILFWLLQSCFLYFSKFTFIDIFQVLDYSAYCFYFFISSSISKGTWWFCTKLGWYSAISWCSTSRCKYFFIFLFRNKYSYIILIYFKQNPHFISIVVFFTVINIGWKCQQPQNDSFCIISFQFCSNMSQQ